MHVCNPQGQNLIFFPVATSIAAYIKQVNETKETVYIRKELNSQRIGFVHQHGRCFIVLEHQYGCHDIMCMRSIQPLLLNKKYYAVMTCYNVKYTFIFHIFSPCGTSHDSAACDSQTSQTHHITLARCMLRGGGGGGRREGRI